MCCWIEFCLAFPMSWPHLGNVEEVIVCIKKDVCTSSRGLFVCMIASFPDLRMHFLWSRNDVVKGWAALIPNLARKKSLDWHQTGCFHEIIEVKLKLGDSALFRVRWGCSIRPLGEDTHVHRVLGHSGPCILHGAQDILEAIFRSWRACEQGERDRP